MSISILKIPLIYRRHGNVDRTCFIKVQGKHRWCVEYAVHGESSYQYRHEPTTETTRHPPLLSKKRKTEQFNVCLLSWNYWFMKCLFKWYYWMSIVPTDELQSCWLPGIGQIDADFWRFENFEPLAKLSEIVNGYVFIKMSSHQEQSTISMLAFCWRMIYL